MPEWLWRWRDRLLASPRFQRWMARFPLTRPIARRKARAMFDLNAGFVYSQILFACVRLDLFRRLADGPLTVAEIAAATDLPEAGAWRLLRSAEALQLVQGAGADRFRLGERGAVILGNPSIAAMVTHHQRLYADLADPVALLSGGRQTRLAEFWPYAAGGAAAAEDAETAGAYSELMASSQALLAEDILDAYSLRHHRCLLDVAGGQGAFMAAALGRWPHLQGQVFDLPAVAARANQAFAEGGLAERANAFGGDMFNGELPSGADVISLVRVLHDHDDQPVRQLLARVHAALPAGGRLLIAEPMAGTRGAEPIGEAYFGFYLLAMGSGRPRTFRELRSMVLEAGFSHCREVSTGQPLLVRVLVAER